MESPLDSRSSPLRAPPHRAFVEISLSQLAENFRSIAATLPQGASMMPVVKANAYGHGALPVAHKLVECGARWLAVSSADEGVHLRESGISLPVRIVVMAGILPFEWQSVLEHSLTPVLHSLAEVSHFEELSSAAGSQIPFHFKIDTGLSRLGSTDSAKSVADVFRYLRFTHPEALMTHYASAANLRSTQTHDQLQRLLHFASQLRRYGIEIPILHADSTNSLHYRPASAAANQFNLVRPGHALYGYLTKHPDQPNAGQLNVKPVLSWRTRVLLVKKLPAGATVGYGALHRTIRPTTIAILGIGYADGYPHRLSKVGRVLLHGQYAPILGSISMDLTTVDVTDILGVEPGDVVTLLGTSGELTIDAIDLARMAGTISYAILTNIHGRVKRIYVP